jgi:hypothetical protein
MGAMVPGATSTTTTTMRQGTTYGCNEKLLMNNSGDWMNDLRVHLMLGHVAPMTVKLKQMLNSPLYIKLLPTLATAQVLQARQGALAATIMAIHKLVIAMTMRNPITSLGLTVSTVNVMMKTPATIMGRDMRKHQGVKTMGNLNVMNKIFNDNGMTAPVLNNMSSFIIKALKGKIGATTHHTITMEDILAMRKGRTTQVMETTPTSPSIGAETVMLNHIIVIAKP